MSRLEELKARSTKHLLTSVRQNSWLTEDDQEFNDLQRQIIQAMYDEHGEAWLGKINLYSNDGGHLVIWRWSGETVYNFECSFVLPRYDSELYRLIMERHRAEYVRTKKDSERLEPIMSRITELGGSHLVWS